jgi:hypothetical protein
VLVVPGMGDSIQAAKAGVLEVADVLVVNKADRPDTQATLRDLRQMVSLATGEWKPPIVPTVATAGDGVDELVGQLDRHDAWLESSGERARRRLARARDEVTALAFGALAKRLAVPDELAARVAEGRCDPAEAAEELLASAVVLKELECRGASRWTALARLALDRLALDRPGLPGLAAVCGHPDLVQARVAAERHALQRAGHAHVAEPVLRRRRIGQRGRLPR